jgi:hypothetical protein
MKVAASSLLFLSLVSTVVGEACLNKHNVGAVLRRWNAIWESGKGSKAFKALSADATVFYDDFGAPPLVGPAAVQAYWDAQPASLKFSKQKTENYFYSCNQIASRWYTKVEVVAADPSLL